MSRLVRMGARAGLVFAAAACSNSPAQPGLPPCSAATAQLISLAPGAETVIDPSTNNGCIAFPANASTTDSAEYLLVPQSDAAGPGDSAAFYLISIAKRPSTQLVRTNRAGTARRSVAAEFDSFLRQSERAGFSSAARRPPPAAAPVAGSAPMCPTSGPYSGLGCIKTFVVCDTFGPCGLPQTKAVGARLSALGSHVAIFVDTLAPANGLDSADLDTLNRTLDQRLYPLDTATFGGVSDIDGNHVIIVLMTGVVNHIVTREFCDSVGYVLGFFFPGDLNSGSRFVYNYGEIYYSLVADPDSTLSCPHTAAAVKRLTPRTFVHEFQHMINYSQHAVLRNGPGEEGWLDEGLSLYAEEVAAQYYFAAGDTARYNGMVTYGALYDSYQYLSDPGSYYLMIPQDDGTFGNIGASWLFVRYLMDQSPPGLAKKLDQTALFGSANVTAATGQDYKVLLSNWALANWVSDLPGYTAPSQLKYTSWHFRTAFDTLRQQFRAMGDSVTFGQGFPLVPMAAAGDSFYMGGYSLRSGTAYYSRALQGPRDPGFVLQFVSGTFRALPMNVVPRLNVVRIR